MRSFTDLNEAEKFLFDAAGVMLNAARIINRYGDEAGHPHLVLGFTHSLPRWEDGAYGDAEVGATKILRALFPDEADIILQYWFDCEDLSEALEVAVKNFT